MDLIKFYSDTSDPVLYVLVAIPLVALAVFFFRGKARILTVTALTFLPILLFIGFVIFSLPGIGFPVDLKKHSWIGMGMVMVPAYNMFWIPPALVGLGLGSLGLLIKRKNAAD